MSGHRPGETADTVSTSLAAWRHVDTLQQLCYTSLSLWSGGWTKSNVLQPLARRLPWFTVCWN